tara:strand:+ start:137 stop:310 length:174 start_codon:yes stop_codon:yes gene_type:complete
MRKIDPNEYMIDGWDQQTDPKYVRGSLYNKVMMTGLWVYYVLFAGMAIRLIWILNTR